MSTIETVPDLRAVAETYFEAWESRDADRIAALHSPDTKFHLHTESDATVGRAEVRDVFAKTFETWPNFSFEARRVLFGEGLWVLDWTLKSSGGALGDVAFGLLDVVIVDDEGLVSRKDTYVDSAELQAAMAS